MRTTRGNYCVPRRNSTFPLQYALNIFPINLTKQTTVHPKWGERSGACTILSTARYELDLDMLFRRSSEVGVSVLYSQFCLHEKELGELKCVSIRTIMHFA